MEGEMFDPGVFLCYFLVNKIKSLNLIDYTFITGDGADQILNRNFFTEDFDKCPSLNRYENGFWLKNPKHCFYFLIVKKLEWLLRLNDIEYVMPFASKEFYDHSKNTTFTEHKLEYKDFVKSYLPKEIGEPLRKMGGLVDEKYFVSQDVHKKLLNIVYSPKYITLFDRRNTNNANLRNILYRIYVILFKYIFIDGGNVDMSFDEILDIIISNGEN
jgi:hypothetical protein